ATVGIGTRRDFYWTLHAALITRHDQREVFDQAFHMFWRDPDLLMRAMNLFMPQLEGEADADQRDINRRVAEAMAPERRPGEGESPEDAKPPEIEIDARLTFSDKEVLQSRDFEQMSADEIAKAKRIIAAMRLPVHDLPTRRFLPDPTGPRVDGRRTLRRSMRGGGDTIELARKRRETRPPALVVLCDISGSMSQYSRMLLHFLHAVSTDRDRVHSFLFGTRLTNITRQLRDKDVDVALAKVGETVGDWSGGTRIGACLDAFNRHWSRRVLGQGAVVLLITDGLERDDTEILAPAMDRLHRSCRRLIWLNPLLRYDAYAPKSQGARAMIGHVDEVRAAHNLDSLAGLAAALDSHFHPDRAEMRRWRALAA
ncbi:MAG: VWA domain-containing protein, partial [Rhodospirillaceae bacterium]|nr:VWA domain-containing protein [Rhodospirillaceae bacterium]